MASQNDTYEPLSFKTFHNIVNGELVPSESHETYHTVNPSTLEPNAEVPLSNLQDVNKAFTAAKMAARDWAAIPWSDRKARLERFATALEASADGFANLLVKENGKPLTCAIDEVKQCARWVRGICSLSLPDHVVEDTADRRVVERFVPLGVAVGIVPWNFPLMLTFFKLPAALLTGNVFILKPSPYAPYCCLKVAELACQIFPPGVFQALSGDDDLGPWLTGHAEADMIAFTGSIATGKQILAGAGLKRVTLEMGGNDPAIVCADVDIDQIVPAIAGIAFVNSGQLCMAIKRLYVHESIYQTFLEKLVGFVQAYLLVGDGREPASFIGPISHEGQFKRVQSYLDNVKQAGLSIALESPTPKDSKGLFIPAVIVDNPPEDARIVTEEPFGPILPVLKWSVERDVIERANRTEFGLGASVWTKDSAQADRVAAQLRAGTIWINTHGELEPTVGYACHKSSGYGVELGIEGLRAYCALQSVYTKPGRLGTGEVLSAS